MHLKIFDRLKFHCIFLIFSQFNSVRSANNRLKHCIDFILGITQSQWHDKKGEKRSTEKSVVKFPIH